MSYKSAAKKPGKKTKNFLQIGAECRRCDFLKVRIKSYCKQEKITQVELAEKMKISPATISRFMSGGSGVQSECYVIGMKYLRTRMPISLCDESAVTIVPTSSKYEWVIPGGSTV
jgi:predicted XRE-type DNA-binding protein